MLPRLCLFAIFGVAAVLRAWGAPSRGLWLDEAFCVRMIQFDWSELGVRAAADNHPPLFFAVLKLWAAGFGTSAAALRWFDVLLGLGGIAVVYALARRVFATAERASVAALIATLWIALHPTHVVWSAQVRMYALAALLAAASALLVLCALERSTWARWAAWVAVAVALIYTHYFGAFVVLAEGLFAIGCAVRDPASRRASILKVVVAGAVIVAGFLPWLQVVIEQSSNKTGQWWVPPLSPSRLLHAWVRMCGLWSDNEFDRPQGVLGIAGVVVACAVAAAVIAAVGARDRALRLVAWCALVPLLAGVIVTLVLGENVVLSRYLIVAEMFVPIAAVGAVFRYPRGGWLLAPVAAVLIAALVREVPSLVPRGDVPAAAAWVAAHRQPGDVVVVDQYFYWSFRIEVPDGDPDLRMYAPDGQPLGFLGASLIDERDTVWGTAELASHRGNLIVVGPINGLGQPFWGVAEQWFAVANPRTQLRVVRYERR